MATLTVYPDADPETDTVDGDVMRKITSEPWATLVAGAGTEKDDSSETANIYLSASATTDEWGRIYRYIALFKTSLLGAAATISAAVLSLYGFGKSDGLSVTPNVDIYTSSPASDTALANADYQQVAAISQTGSPIAYADWSSTGYNDFTFNATGRGNISKTGISKFGARNANYDVSGTPPAWSHTAVSYLTLGTAEKVNTTTDPKLVITYTAPVGPANMKTFNGLAAASVKTVNGLAIASVKTWGGLA